MFHNIAIVMLNHVVAVVFLMASEIPKIKFQNMRYLLRPTLLFMNSRLGDSSLKGQDFKIPSFSRMIQAALSSQQFSLHILTFECREALQEFKGHVHKHNPVDWVDSKHVADVSVVRVV